MPRSLLLGLAAALALYALFVLALVALGRRSQARALAGFVPDCVVLVARLLRDPRVSRGRRAVLLALAAYLALPFDLVPDFIPVAGQLDDAILLALGLRLVLAGAGPALLRRHWPGPEASYRVVLRLAGGGGASPTLPVEPLAQGDRMVQEGDAAPDFEMADQDGEPVRLSSLRGRPVVLYFYPKADTPGCTTQACGIRDHQADYDAAGAVVLGVSPDDPAALRGFVDKFGLPFTLLSDADHATAEAYGVWVEKTRDGRTSFGNERSTFVIDAEGTVRSVLRKVQPKTHDELVLEALRAA